MGVNKCAWVGGPDKLRWGGLPLCGWLISRHWEGKCLFSSGSSPNWEVWLPRVVLNSPTYLLTPSLPVHHPTILRSSPGSRRGPGFPASPRGRHTRGGVKDTERGYVPSPLLQPQPPPACPGTLNHSGKKSSPPAPPQWGALATPPPVLAKGLNLLF